MYPVLVEFNGWRVYSFGLAYALAILAGFLTARSLARRRGLEPRYFSTTAIATILAGFAGTRLFYLIFASQSPSSAHDMLSQPLQSGSVWYGAPLLGLPCLILFSRYFGLPLLKTLDSAAPGIALGQAVGRIGCFLGGCCYGIPTALPWGVPMARYGDLTHYPAVTRHPVQLYESTANLLIFLGLLAIFRRNLKPGAVVLAYFMLYSLIRFILEYWRGDSIRGFVLGGLLSTSQLVSLMIFFFCAAIVCLQRGPTKPRA